MKIRPAFLLPAFLALICPLTAQTPNAEAPSDTIHISYRFKPVIVTATKLKNARRDLAASISVLSSRDLEMAGSSSVLSSLQQEVPSFYLTEWGVMGFGVAGVSAGKISLRGVGGGANTNVLILRDGRPDFMGLMGCTIADEFTSDGIERVEVIRGPGSFLYGTNATGGVINLIPRRRDKEGFETTFSLGGGSYQSRSYSLAHGGKVGSFDYYLTANQRQTEGHRENADYRGRHYTFHAGYNPNRRLQLDMNANMADIYLLDPGPVSAPRDDNWYDILRGGGDVNLIYNGPLGETNLKLHANFGKHRFFDGWRSRDRLLGAMVYHNTALVSGNKTTLGFDIKRYGGSAVDSTSDYGSIFLSEYAPYIHSQQLLLGHLIVSGGLRAEHHQLFGWEMLPKVGIVLHPVSAYALRFSAAKGFRSPSIRELYFWMPANDQLSPDRVNNIEVGASGRTGSFLYWEATLFRTKGSNLIQLSGPPPRWLNSGSYVHTGYELVLHCTPARWVQFGGSWSDIDLDPNAYNIPARKLTLNARLQYWGYVLDTRFRLLKDIVGADFPGPSPAPVLHPLADYSVLDITMLAPLPGRLEVKCSLNNLLDARYEAMYGYPMPGRNISLDLRYKIL